jgi:hypothetical protein
MALPVPETGGEAEPLQVRPHRTVGEARDYGAGTSMTVRPPR